MSNYCIKCATPHTTPDNACPKCGSTTSTNFAGLSAEQRLTVPTSHLPFAERSAKLAQDRADGNAVVSYDTIISERQRAHIADALQFFRDNAGPDEQPTDDAADLLELFRGLPAAEAETPGVTHGLCL
jgi:hypothetical protein